MKTMFKAVKRHFALSALAVLLTAFAPQNAFAVNAVAQQVQGDVLVHKAS